MRPQLTPLPDDLSEMAALAEEQLEDLGWNDMGADRDGPTDRVKSLLSSKPNADRAQHSAPTADEQADRAAEDVEVDGADGAHPILDPLTSADIVPIDARAERLAAANEDGPDINARFFSVRDDDSIEGESPVVRRQQKSLERQVLADAAMAQASTATSNPNAPRAAKSGRRAAFTLRLDTERHLKLRLAATMQGVSAQSLVTEALDAMLESIEELGPLVERMQRD